MYRWQKALFWVLIIAIMAFLLYTLRSVLLPFAAGLVLGYILDPLCDWFERRGLSRTLSTIMVCILMVTIMVVIFALFIPFLVVQVGALANAIPHYVDTLTGKINHWINDLGQHYSVQVNEVLGSSSKLVNSSIAWASQFLGQVVVKISALVSFISLLVITPVVAFYMLRDWDVMVAKVDQYLPREYRKTIHFILKDIDRTLSGFLRGQLLVCLTLGSFYAIVLTLCGLKFGFVVGMLAGLLSFIPYVGTITGAVLSVGLALAQYDSFAPVLLVAGIFILGQMLEAYVLTPRFVGGRVGLHAVWIIFSLMAGGALLGFLGMLIAIPVAASIGVVLRFSLRQYQKSGFYLGRDKDHF